MVTATEESPSRLLMETKMPTIKVFHYVEELDAFLVTPQFADVSERLGLAEWTPVVWIGRLFLLDNDYGEHWFDNWDEREDLVARAEELGIASYDLMVITSWRFQNGKDGPCHTNQIRKMFWTDVLKSLELSYDLVFEEARQHNLKTREINERHPQLRLEYVEDLETTIAETAASLSPLNK